MGDTYDISRRELLGTTASAMAAASVAGCMQTQKKDEDEYRDVELEELILNIEDYHYDDVRTTGYPGYVGNQEWKTGCCSSTRHTFEIYTDPDADTELKGLVAADDDDGVLRNVVPNDELLDGGVYDEPIELFGEVRRWGTDHSFWTGTKNEQYVLAVADAETVDR